MLRLYNTFFNKKEKFVPIKQNFVTMYVCGPTVYNEIHVGNARSLIVFDLLYKILKKEHSEVVFVRNITDIDDKIIQRAQRETKSSQKVAIEWEESFHRNCKKLGLIEPQFQPRATETINEIIQFIVDLIEYEFAYIQEDSVFFKINSIEEYGKLSKQNNTIAGKRLQIDLRKQNHQDFVLWKASKKGEPYWNSPWGAGRPGWHIECSAMSAKFLGERFDIHGGGQDLLFPHHENERAQNIGLYGEDAGPRYWIHNAMILFGGQKMSKSLGNVILLSDVFEKWDAAVVKFFILNTHYRHQLFWKEESLMQSYLRLKRWLFHLEKYLEEIDILEEIYEALLDDMNVPAAFTLFEELLSQAIQDNDIALLKKLGGSLNWLGCVPEMLYNFEIESMLKQKLIERKNARAVKDYNKADSVRAEIKKYGYEIIDSNEEQILKKIL